MRNFLIILLFLLESSGYQFKDGIKKPQNQQHFSFLGDTKLLLHILQVVKASTKRSLKLVTH
jgi:hypothetical protein